MSSPENQTDPVASRLLRLRNESCRINRLPVELLRYIFEDASAPVYSMAEPCNMTNLAISWTCSHWRDVALQDPQLWAHLDLRFLELASLFAERSRTCSLSIRSLRRRDPGVEGGDRHAGARDALCLTYWDRIRILHYQPTTPQVPPWLCDLAAPHLEEIKICVGPCNAPLSRIPRLLGNQAPRLQRLDLQEHRLPFVPGSWPFRGLRSLKIHVSARTPILDADEDLLVVFRECPELETLELHMGWIQERPEALFIPPRGEPIDMLSLRELRLTLPGTYISTILAGVNIPVHQMSSISIVQACSFPSPHFQPAQLLRRHQAMFAPLFTFAHDLRVSRTRSSGFGPRSLPLEIEGKGLAENGKPFSFFIGQSSRRSSMRDYDLDCMEMMKAALDRDMPVLRRLVVEDAEHYFADHGSNAYNFLLLLRGLNSVTDLTFIGSIHIGVAAIFRGESEDPLPKDSVLPNLRHLTLERYNAGRSCSRYWIGLFFETFAPHVETVHLLDCTLEGPYLPPPGATALQHAPELQSIYEHFGHSLQQLQIERCHLGIRGKKLVALNLCQALHNIPNVTWDYSYFTHFPDENGCNRTYASDLVVN